MTDNEKFEDWLQKYMADHFMIETNWGSDDPRQRPSVAREISNAAWDSALAIGRRQGMEEIDYRRLSDKITEVVAQGLHYAENMEQINTMRTAKEVSTAINGGIDRYRTDHIYHAKVQAMVAQLMDAIRAAIKEG